MEQKELKSQYCKRNTKYWMDDFWDDKYYPSLRNNWYRSFSTKQEKSCSQMHEIEYADFAFRVRSSRNKGLIDSWDDVKSSEKYGRKSWKHHTKRRHQYFRIMDF